MKKVSIVLILAFALMSCGGGKTAKAGEAERHSETTVNSDATSEEELSGISSENYFDENDPLSELIVEYTPEQLKQIIGKAEPKDVRDLLLLLPDTDFLLYFNFDVEQRKKMLKGETISHINIDKIDVRNGYISSGYEGTWEMFVKKIDGIWWIAVYENNCGEFCSTVQAKTYTYSEGKLVQRNHANLAGYQDLWVELFVDFSQLTKEQQRQANKVWNELDKVSDVLFKLPRDGKTITMYVESEYYTEVGIPEEAIREVKKEIWK